MAEQGYPPYNFARSYHFCYTQEQTVAGIKHRHTLLHQQLALFLKYFIPKNLIILNDPAWQSHSVTNTEALLRVALELLSFDLDTPFVNLDKRRKGELTNALKTELYWKIVYYVMNDLRYPLDFRYNSTIVQLCNRELVDAVERMNSDYTTELKTPEMRANRGIKLIVHRDGTFTTKNCPLLMKNANLQKKVAFLSSTLELCAHNSHISPGPAN